jgi:hypothetical protein
MGDNKMSCTTWRFRVDRVLTQLGWRKLADKTTDQFKLKWVEARSAINYESLREGETRLLVKI